MPTLVTAHQKYIRTSARKLRLSADLVRGLSVNLALVKLDFAEKRSALEIKKVLIQAQKNAVNNSHLIPETLKLHTIKVDEGPTYKRWQPVSRGRAHPIMKRTSHLLITVMGEPNAPKPLITKTKQNKEKNGTKS